MLSEQEIAALADTEPTTNVVQMPPPKPKTEAELQKEREEADRAGLAAVEALPFDAKTLLAVRVEQHEKRLPEFIENTQKQIRQAAFFGHPACELITEGFPKTIVDSVKAYLGTLLFRVEDTKRGFSVDLQALADLASTHAGE